MGPRRWSQVLFTYFVAGMYWSVVALYVVLGRDPPAMAFWVGGVVTVAALQFIYGRSLLRDAVRAWRTIRPARHTRGTRQSRAHKQPPLVGPDLVFRNPP